MADKDSTAAPLPGAFADAPEPDPVKPIPAASGSDNGTGDTPEKKPAQSEKGLKSSGVPKARLLGWAIPVLGVVAGVAMYNQSPMGAAVMFGVAFLILLIAGVMHLLKGRGGKGSSSGGGGRSAPQSRPRGQRRMPWSRSGGRGGRSGGASGSSRGASGGSSGGRGIRGRFSRNGGGASGGTGRTGGGTGGAGAASAGRTGTSTAKGGSGGKRNWNPLRRNRAGNSPNSPKSTTGANGSSGTPTSGRGASSSPTGKRSMLPWRRNKTAAGGTGPGRSGSSTTSGAASPSGRKPASTGTGTGSGRRRFPLRRKNSTTPTTARTNPAGVGPGASRPGNNAATGNPPTRRERTRARIQNWRGRKNPATNTTNPDGAANTGGHAATRVKSEKQPRWRPWRRRTSQGNNSHETSENRPSGTRPEGRRARARRKEAEKNQPVLDDAGFPLVDISKPEPAKPSKPVDRDPIAVDDAGFPSYAAPQQPPPVRKTPTRHKKGKEVDTSPYMDQVDSSTPQTTQATMTAVAEVARRDAANLREEVEKMRRNADALGDKPGMVEGAEELRREAAAKAMVVEARLAVAAAFENEASQIKVAA
jgi:hypothetical protein